MARTVKQSTEKSTDKRRKNLKPAWKPGQSGNPKGRKPGTSLTALLKEEIDQVCPAAKVPGQTWRQVLIEATMRLAIKGNAHAMKEIWERLDGKVKEELDVTGGLKIVRFPERASNVDEWENDMGAAEGATDETSLVSS